MVIRPTRVALLLLLGLFAHTAASDAAVTRGTRAPEIDAREVGSDTAVLLGDLRGRMVLLEFFGTDCPHCKRLAGRMNEIHARFGSRGLTVLGVTPDAPGKVRRFVREQGVRHQVARVPMDALRRYAVKDYPLGILVAPDGRVLWRGKPARLTDRVLEVYRSRVRVLPDVPPGFLELRPALHARRYGEVERALEARRTCRPQSDADCAFVLATLAFVAWQRERALAAAAEDERRGRNFTALVTYEEIETAYAGSPAARRAAQARERLLEEPARRAEIRAQAALERARRLGRWKSIPMERSHLRGVVEQHPETAAAREASALLALLDGQP